MTNIVLVWEMGADLGHITRLDALARHLCVRGHTVTAIFSDLREILRIYSPPQIPPYRILQGPSWRDRRLKLSRPPASLTEVLLSVGFYKSQIIAEKLLQWKTLFANLQADVIFFDYAPAAQLAARQYTWHKINLGDPFSTPPAGSPLPLFDVNAKVSDANLMISDQRLLGVVNQALQEMKIAEIQYVHELFSADKTFLLSIPELDPFAHLRASEQYTGPINTPANSVHLNWNGNSGKKVFGYLKPAYPHLKEFLQGISKLHVQGRFFIPEAPLEILKQYGQSNIEIATTPYDLSSELEQCDLVVCHGGHSTLLHSVLNGIPTLLIPLQQEQLCVTQKVIASGLAVRLGHGIADTEQISAISQSVLNDADLRHAAQNCALRYKQAFTSPALETITQYVESLS